MDLSDLFELEKIANDLVTATDPNATLVFIGQSPAYIRVAIGNRRKIIQVSSQILSKYMPDKVDPELARNYCKYLASIGITKELLESDRVTQDKKIVASQDIRTHRVVPFIDFTESGSGINSFAELLKFCYGPSVIPIKVIVLLYKSQINYLNVISLPNIVIVGEIYITKSLLQKLANEKYPRIVPSYLNENWGRLPDYENIKLSRGYYVFQSRTYEKLHQEIINACSAFSVMSFNDINRFIEMLKNNGDDEVRRLLDQITSSTPMNELCSKISIVYAYLQKKYETIIGDVNRSTTRESPFIDDYNPQPSVPRDESSFERLVMQ